MRQRAREIHAPKAEASADALTRNLPALDGLTECTLRQVEQRSSPLDVDQLVLQRAADLRLHRFGDDLLHEPSASVEL